MLHVEQAFSIVDRHVRFCSSEYNTQWSKGKSLETNSNKNSNNKMPALSTVHIDEGTKSYQETCMALTSNFDYILPAFRTAWRDGPCPYHTYRGSAQCSIEQIVNDSIDTQIIDTNNLLHDKLERQEKATEKELLETKRAWETREIECTVVPSTFKSVTEPVKLHITHNNHNSYTHTKSNSDCESAMLQSPSNIEAKESAKLLDKIEEKNLISDENVALNEVNTASNNHIVAKCEKHKNGACNELDFANQLEEQTALTEKDAVSIVHASHAQKELENALNKKHVTKELSKPIQRRFILQQHCVRHYPFGALGLRETPLSNDTGKLYKEHQKELHRLCNRECRQILNNDYTPSDHVFGPICNRSSHVIRGRLYNAPGDHLLGAVLL